MDFLILKTIFNAVKPYLIYIIIALALIFMGWLFYHKYTTTVEANIQMKNDISQLNQKVEQQQTKIKQVEDDAKMSSQIQNDIYTKLGEYKKQEDALSAEFRKHNLGKLADAKPKLLEKIVNKGSDDLKRCFEIASGSPLTKEEKDAKKPNSQCPDLFPKPSS